MSKFTIFIFFSLFFSTTSFANATDVCQRSNSMRVKIEEYLAKSCDEITAQDLTHILGLKFDYQKNENPNPADFQGMTNLKRLDLRLHFHSSVNVLPKTIFNGLVSLKSLSIGQHFNSEEVTFRGQKSLKKHHNLYFSSSSDVLPETIFEGLVSLEELSIDRVSDIKEYTFRGLKSLKKLRIEEEFMEGFAPNLFRDLSSLQELVINSNGTTEEIKFCIPETVFQDLTSLKALKLKTLADPKILPKTFENLKALEELDISWNYMNTPLDENLLKGLVQLKKFNAGVNFFTSIPEKIFDGLTSLEVIGLEAYPYNLGTYPRLTTLPPKLLHDLPLLKEVYLGNQGFTSISPEAFDPALFSKTATVYLRNAPLEKETLKLLKDQLRSRLNLINLYQD